MKRLANTRTVLIAALMAISVSTAPGCAWMFGGFQSKPIEQRSAEIDWGFFALDILFTGGIGLIIDFGTGAIYRTKGTGLLAFAGPLDACDEARSAFRGSRASDFEGKARWFGRHVEGCGICKKAILTAKVPSAQRIVPDGRSVYSLDAPIAVNLNRRVSEE